MKQNRTALRVIQIMDLLTEHKKGLSLSEIVKHLNLPKTSVFDIVHTLKSVHMLRLEDKKFTIGFHAYKIGCSYIRTKDLYSIARKKLIQVADEIKLSVSLILYEDEILNYIFQHNPLTSYANIQPVDLNDAMHASASGKVILANLDPAEQKLVVNKIKFNRFTDKTIRNKTELYKELNLTKKRGYGLDDEEYTEHFFCISIPIFDNDKILAAVSFSGIKVLGNFNDKDVISKLLSLSRELSKELSNLT